MVTDAEARLASLTAKNERNGPLFKMDDDPRVTRLGRILRDSSLDEVPQLINVLKGEMSLIGPRPALPAEVEMFDNDLVIGRTKVRPGITGLWQVEARDNPSFKAYKRLDLFYVDNWSVSLDLVILVATFEQVIARLVTTLLRRRRVEEPSRQPSFAEAEELAPFTPETRPAASSS
jgi:lipopolysaccharide/colanic/teichoic acid biosynthesis glycosyltransferase